MTIDWITVSAQIVNFLILVGLLKRFLYQPVISAMDQREQHIAERLMEAQQREAAAEEEARQLQGERGALEQQREQILAESRAAAEAENRQLLAQGRDDVVAARVAWERQLKQQQGEFLGSLRRRTSEAVQEIATKVLGDLADTELETRIIDRFIDRLAATDEHTREQFVQSAGGVVRISSTFELSAAVRERLQHAVREYLTEAYRVEFSRADDLLCGIVLDHAGRRLSWNIADYLDELAQRLDAAFAPGPAAVAEGAASGGAASRGGSAELR